MLEEVDHVAQRRINDRRVPRRDRQKIYDDVLKVWKMLKHARVSEDFETHILNLPLDGSKDSRLLQV